jgi:hypothetical protein
MAKRLTKFEKMLKTEAAKAKAKRLALKLTPAQQQLAAQRWAAGK